MTDELQELPEREAMEFDLVIVGGGPAGLSAAIKFKQLAAAQDKDLSVVLVEKGSEIGAHILSGAVIDPIGLNKLIPDWKEKGAPLKTQVTDDQIRYLGPDGSFKIPNFTMPPLMNNHGNYIVSLGDVCRWLGEQAEELGVEIYPGIPGSEILYSDDGSVLGIATGDMGVSEDGKPKDSYMRGMELRGKYTFFAEGVRGSLSKEVIAKYNLDENSDPQKFGIGLKELWEVKPENHKPGLVQHTLGWPLDSKTGGGSFLYHFGDNLVSVGFVVHLNYENPYLSPYDEFQRFKTHTAIKDLFDGGKRISYGARAITEGGFQSVPELVFPGGALIGCAAGFVNVPRIKGSHNAMLTGMMAAAAAFKAIEQGRAHDVLGDYAAAYENSEVYKDLKRVRNVKPLLSRFGTLLGTMLGGVDMWLNTILPFLSHTLSHKKPDHACTGLAKDFSPIDYPRPDGKLTFDKLTNVSFSATNHEEDQVVHLKLGDPSIPIGVNLPKYAEPAQLYCPASVYEVLDDADGNPVFRINSQNCVHCKTCDIKDPAQNITWICPEGGGGPNYPNM